MLPRRQMDLEGVGVVGEAEALDKDKGVDGGRRGMMMPPTKKAATVEGARSRLILVVGRRKELGCDSRILVPVIR